MVCHMLGILTLEEFEELALDGITIPHGQWTSTFFLSHGLLEEFNEPQLGVAFIIDQRKLCLTIVKVLRP